MDLLNIKFFKVFKDIGGSHQYVFPKTENTQ
jgi:hypothetical protein